VPEGRGGYDPQGKASCNTLVLSSGAPARHSHLGPPQSRRIRVLAFADVLLTQSLQLAPPSFDLQDVRAPGEIMFHKIAKLSHVSSTNEVGDQCKQSQIYRQLSLVSRLFYVQRHKPNSIFEVLQYIVFRAGPKRCFVHQLKLTDTSPRCMGTRNRGTLGYAVNVAWQ